MKSQIVRAMILLVLPGLFASMGSTRPRGRPEAAPGMKPEEPVSDDLQFVTGFVLSLRKAGIAITSVSPSVWWGAVFEGTNRAARIKTDRGVVNVVVFASPEAAKQIQVEQISDGEEERYQYSVRETPDSPPQRIDSARPIYFIIYNDKFICTSDRGLAKEIEHALGLR